MKTIRRRGTALILTAIMMLCTCATVTAANVSSASIGGNTCSMVRVPMDGSVTGELTLAWTSTNKDMAAGEHIKVKKSAGGRSLVASVNGALFNAYYNEGKTLSYPDNCARIYGSLIINGQAVKGAGETPMLGFTSDGKALIDRVKVGVSVKYRRSDSVGCWGVNDYYKDATSIVLLTGEMGYPVTLQTGAVLVYIKNGIVSNIVTGQSSVTVPMDGTKVVVYNASAWSNAVTYSTQPRQGNCAEITTTLTPRRPETTGDWAKVITGVGCGPWLLQGGKDVTSDNGEFSDPKMAINAKAARSFAAVMSDGSLVLGAATASFKEIANYLISAGAKDAMALDGGASSMLYAEGQGYLRSAGRKLSNVLHIVDYPGNLPQANTPADIVTPSGWAVESINLAKSSGLIPDGFDLAARENITRLEFCQLADALLQVYYGSGITAELNDCALDYNAARAKMTDCWDIAVVNCFRLGLIDGVGNNKFDPNGSLTREQAAKILAGVSHRVGIEVKNSSMSFSDADTFSSWAVDGIDGVCRRGIMNGVGNGRFAPKEYFTKEQAVKTFQVMFEECGRR